ncbi:hypothetical protein [uncultured Sphingomonas sp.]|uniref:hypothetical protein n=1 Tax=uncultured Sphingomonas sp. TaxID=158754 RepID=UPI0025CF1B88|nr:hypothetical protein [uncultured Sphingomonas sp.]
MAIAENNPPCSLGLGGDGDEIAAIKDVENHFGVQLDYSDARNWTTVGDVFSALERELPADHASADDIWTQFANAICMETGVDPGLVTRDTLLLGQHRFDRRLLLLVASIIGLAFAIDQYR